MKLRNKKTGDIGVIRQTIHVTKENDICNGLGSYSSLAELNADWEDYKPAEPLIKDEKIRKAVRAWADGNECINVQFDAFWRGFRHNDSTITIWDDLPLKDGAIYSIAELCGEEKE